MILKIFTDVDICIITSISKWIICKHNFSLSITNLKYNLSDRKIYPRVHVPQFVTLGFGWGIRLRFGFGAGFTKHFKTRSYFLVQSHVKGCQSKTQTFQIKIWAICLHIMLSTIMKIEDIYQGEDTDRVYANVRTGPWATHVVRSGHLLPTGAMLVTSGWDLVCYWKV